MYLLCCHGSHTGHESFDSELERKTVEVKHIKVLKISDQLPRRLQLQCLKMLLNTESGQIIETNPSQMAEWII